MNRTLTLATVALIGLAVALAFTITLHSSDQGSARPSVGAPETDVSPVASGEVAAQQPSELITSDPAQLPDTLPASLEGTNVPSGWARIDANGALIPTPELRELFEYYLAALGEETLEQLVARIQNALANLPEPARSEAGKILGAYLDYKLALGEIEGSMSDAATMDPDAMARQLADIRALRRQWLDAETAEAFFALEEAVDQFQVAQMRIRADDSLTDQERQVQLLKAEESLPAPIRESRQQTRKFSEYQQVRQQLADDPQALQAWREDAFGAEAAERLAQVEAEQQDWERRWRAYQQDKAELEGLAGPEKEAAVERLRAQYFEGPERHRAQALDSLQ
ncbi:lipase secretion chaperone [Marinobacter sp. CHS3-4]|uniref:lipase secretion chaperone n=1 Tax=Marinobacter sp. CHS3-4 TaxID=3045174 RepID=UPI0024B56D93|nr:lipase secretion chaperone [Marinobacter sp. CHS3-4]MDI9244105.1 lipase secretion chaperone [Marinobacter sp. CHS3-4]